MSLFWLLLFVCFVAFFSFLFLNFFYIHPVGDVTIKSSLSHSNAHSIVIYTMTVGFAYHSFPRSVFGSEAQRHVTSHLLTLASTV